MGGRDVYLELAPGISVAVPRDEAERLDKAGLTRLYQRSVFGATRKQARAWADRQISERGRARAA